jgi:heme-degrading monooxygenase HmoA
VIAVLFEVWLDAGAKARYLELAASLRARLETVDGFVSVERFQSLGEPDKLLSVSWWRDERAVAAWRAAEAHRDAQREGREELFRDYRLRVAAVVRDYGARDRAQAPAR